MIKEVFEPTTDYKALCVCITYNQSQYITQAMDGFTRQKTSFPYVCCIVDDASSDNEPEVIEEYINQHFIPETREILDLPSAKLIIAVHAENCNCTFAAILLKTNLWMNPEEKDKLIAPWRSHSEYEALCDGDDYWFDYESLQKQISFLDKNPDIGFIYAKAHRLKDGENEYSGVWGRGISNYMELLTESSCIPTSTACYRTKLATEYHAMRKNDPIWPLPDVTLWMFMLYRTKVYFVDEFIAVYRELPESVSHSLDFYRKLSFCEAAYDCRAFYAKRYWGDSAEKAVREKQIRIAANMSLRVSKFHKKDLLSRMLKYKIFDIKLFMLVLLSYTWLTRHIYKHTKSIFKIMR
ncbi:MAG: glycosyltransferase [Bacteroidaceae bacterium]|nr:glycosyltransferase [Bacteroidaceae bacterium]